MMKRTIATLCAILSLIYSPLIFAQQTELCKSTLTIGIYDSANCGLLDSTDRSTNKLPEDKISEKVKKHIKAEYIGTGFIYGYNGKKYVITCEHVIFKSNKIIGYDADFKSYELKLIGGDTFYDVAVLEFVESDEGKLFESVQFETKLPDVGEQVQSIGYWNLDHTRLSFSGEVLDSELILKDTKLPVAKLGFIEHTAKLPKGFSGGLLISNNDKVLGMNVLRRDRGDYFYALQSKIVKRLVEDIVDNGKVQRAFTGIQFAQNMEGGSVVVNEIISNSPASEYRDQLQQQPIKKINGNDVYDIYSVLQIMEKIRPGTPITLELNKGKFTFTSERLGRESLRQIAEHAVQYHKDIIIRGEVVIVKVPEEEVAMTAGKPKPKDLIYCLDRVEQLGSIIRIFGLHGGLKIGTDNDLQAGREINFSEDDDTRVLYY